MRDRAWILPILAIASFTVIQIIRLRPRFVMETPANGQTVFGTIQVRADVKNIEVETIQFQVDGATIGVKYGPPYSYNLDTSQFTNTRHTIVAKAKTHGGQEIATPPVYIVVSNATQLPGPSNEKLRTPISREDVLLCMQVIVSLSVLFPSLYLILSQKPSRRDAQKWAYGTIGLVLGFWLK